MNGSSDRRVPISEYYTEMFKPEDYIKAQKFWEEEIRQESEAIGEKRGEKRGEDKANISNIRKIMKKMNLSPKKAMDFMDISAEDQERYAPLLLNNYDA